MNFDKTLFVIPARGGSKGVPRKNIKILAGRPLIMHSLSYARLFVPDTQICISTDDLDIVELVKKELKKLKEIPLSTMQLHHAKTQCRLSIPSPPWSWWRCACWACSATPSWASSRCPTSAFPVRS